VRKSLVALFGVLLGLASGLATNGCGDEDKQCDAASRPTCVNDLGNGQCTDLAQDGVCNGGQWTCPSGTVRQDQCLCTGAPPATGCTCAGASTNEGWSCH
jgi:hypothetical protein